MINYQVEDLDAVLEALRAEGVTIDPKREDHEYGVLPGSWTRKETASSYGSRQKPNAFTARTAPRRTAAVSAANLHQQFRKPVQFSHSNHRNHILTDHFGGAQRFLKYPMAGLG
jgi:hypothetical protein